MYKIMKKKLKIILIALISAVLAVALAYFAFNAIVVLSASSHITTMDECEESVCAIVLGAGVRADGSPTWMLRDRLDTAIKLYEDGKVDKILMSGDHHTTSYDEVNNMKQYAIDAGVPSEDIFMDHAGLCTYDTMNRAKNIFCLEKAIIVTQEYHLYRAVFLARSFGIDAQGVATDNNDYGTYQFIHNNIRESIARCKDFLYSIFKPDTTIMGDLIPITPESNGDVTNDK